MPLSTLVLFEFEMRLLHLGSDEISRHAELSAYRSLLDEIAVVDDSVRTQAIRLRASATDRIAAMDVLIAATASVADATLVHRDPHFAATLSDLLKQMTLPMK